MFYHGPDGKPLTGATKEALDMVYVDYSQKNNQELWQKWISDF